MMLFALGIFFGWVLFGRGSAHAAFLGWVSSLFNNINHGHDEKEIDKEDKPDGHKD